MSPLIKTPLLATPIISERAVPVIRGRSVEPLNKGILSEKVPISFSQTGIVVHPIPTISLAREDKISLYSEIERLTMINYEFKGQNESLHIELERAQALACRVPELEAIIRNLQAEVVHKDDSLDYAAHTHELLKIDNVNLTKLEPAYNELLEHNRSLLIEIDSLDIKLKELLRERDILEANCETVKMLEPRLADATRRVEIMTADILDRDQQIAHFVARVQELEIRLNSLILENQELRDDSAAHVRENEIMRGEVEFLLATQQHRLDDLRIQVEGDTSFEINRLSEAYKVQTIRIEEELLQARKVIQTLQDQIEDLRRRNIEKSGEIDDLKLRIVTLDDDNKQAIMQSEVESHILVARQLSEQKAHHDVVIVELRKEIAELEKFRIMAQSRELEVESMKVKMNNSEKTWGLRLQHAVESEAKSASTKHTLERSLLEAEFGATRDQMLSLENQTSYLSEEVDRLNNLYGKKVSEVNELQRKLTTQEIDAKVALEDQRTKLEIERISSLDELRRELEQIHQGRIDEMRRFQISLEEKMLHLMDENRRVSELADDRVKEADSASLRLKMMEDIHRNQIQESEKRFEMNQRVAVEKEVSSASLKHKGERNELEIRIAQLSIDLERTKSHAQNVEKELDRTRQNLQGRDLELQQEKRRLVELEIQRNRDINEVREQFESYKRANVDVTTLHIKFDAERAAFNSQLAQHKDKISETEKRLVLFIGENEKMRNLYNEKASELEVLRLRYRELEERWYNDKGDLEKEVDYLKRTSLDSKEVNIRFVSEKSQLENQIKQLKTVSENGKQELEKLYELMNQRKQEHDYYIRQNEELKREIEKLARQARDINNESFSKIDRYEGVERTLREVEKDRDLYKAQVERLNTQLEVTHSELLEKIRELDNSKTKYDESVKKISTQLDKDLMTKMLGTSLNMSPERRTYSSGGGYDF